MPIITPPLVGAISEAFETPFSHDDLNSMFMRCGAFGPMPDGGKKAKVRKWIDATVLALDDEGQLAFLGALLHDFMEGHRVGPEGREFLTGMLEKSNLRYVNGGRVVSALHGVSTASLEKLIQKRDFPAVNQEFERALNRVEGEPREAASAAANILEAICKEYILANGLPMPTKLDLSSVFSVVSKHLNFDPKSLEDDDLKRILGGLFSTVDGIAALRTHASSAHAQNTSQRVYNLGKRHARLAVHAAHTIGAFILETWEARAKK